jgi:hypothetical protein
VNRRAGAAGRTSCTPDIAADEELTNDYATSTGSEDWTMDCPAACCRLTITGDDSRLPGLQQRYGDHWVPAVLTRIRCGTSSSLSRAGT